MSVREKLASRVARADLSLPNATLDALSVYFDLLRKWNRKVSLTSLPVEDVGDEAVDRLIVEPIIAAHHFPTPGPVVFDIGSGGGSPAIPMRLAAPTISLRMVESKTRKAAFLREVVRALDLDRVAVDAIRFEELVMQPAFREAADVVTVRAVRADRKFLVELQPLVRPGGHVFLFGAGSAASPENMPPSLEVLATHALLPQWGSRLDVLQKVVP